MDYFGEMYQCACHYRVIRSRYTFSVSMIYILKDRGCVQEVFCKSYLDVFPVGQEGILEDLAYPDFRFAVGGEDILQVCFVTTNFHDVRMYI